MSATATWYAVSGPNGDLTWRVQSPAAAIGAKTVLIPDTWQGFKSLTRPNRNSRFPWQIDVAMADGRTIRVSGRKRWRRLTRKRPKVTGLSNYYPEHEGAAVWTRPLAFGAAHMMEMRRQGVRVSAEVDDNYLSETKLNVFMRLAQYGDNDRDNHSRSICVGDALIVTTEYLRDVYWKGLSDKFGKSLVPDIFVCRNHIDERYIPAAPAPRDGRLRIGYMGSDSHVWDVDLIFEALYAAAELGHEIVFIGLNPVALNPKFRKGRARNTDWSRVPYTHIPWINEGFRGSALPLDIGLAPLLVDHYTLGKSDIKALEYALSGAACVAQNCLVYNRTLTHGEHVLMASSPREFHDRVLELIRKPALRERLVANTMQYVREERLLSKNTREWEEAVLGV